MPPNERTRNNHEQLFPGHVSRLAVSDPELIELFDDFAFDDVLRHDNLDVRTRLMPLGGCEAQVKGHVAANLNVGNDRGRLIDVLTQLPPFIGYPRTLNALRVLNEVTSP
jgi:4-carboxymuconolactone decarboxylase